MPVKSPQLDFGTSAPRAERQELAVGAILLAGFAIGADEALLAAIEAIQQTSPFRHMVTPGGWLMSVAMTNCGQAGWITDKAGYRYDAVDPETGHAWPAMPQTFEALAVAAADTAGFPGFTTDACLINRYEPGARLGEGMIEMRA